MTHPRPKRRFVTASASLPCCQERYFAKTGDPNNPSIPAWPPYDANRRATMVFDARMRVVDDYRGDFVRLINPPKAG